MLAEEFEARLTSVYKCYIIRPRAINWNADSDFLSDADMFRILDNNAEDVSKCVRKRSEGISTTAFYLRGRKGDQYFKVVLNNATQTGGGYMTTIKEYFDKHQDQRLLVKYTILAIGGIFFTYAAAYASSGNVPPEFAAILSMGVAYLNDKFKLLSPLEPWAIIGARDKEE